MTHNTTSAFETYPCHKIVYRACLYPDWIKPNRKIKKQAFFRYDKDKRGISVTPDLAHCTDGLTGETFGTIALPVGWVRDLGLDVIPDSPTHANIVGVPTRDQNRELAMHLADGLAKIARVLD
jgi:hypothetical protein